MSSQIVTFPTRVHSRRCRECGSVMVHVCDVASPSAPSAIRILGCLRCETIVRDETTISRAP
jgi:hypothetical protein